MCTAVLFTIAKIWKQPKCSMTDENVPDTHKMENYSAIGRTKLCHL